MTKTLKKYMSAATVTATGILASVSPALAQIYVDPTVDDKKTGYATDFGLLLNSVLTLVMVIAALLVFIYLIWGGVEWITSGGDKGKTESARNKITAAIIGLIVLAASYAILLIALRFLGFTDIADVFDKVQIVK